MDSGYGPVVFVGDGVSLGGTDVDVSDGVIVAVDVIVVVGVDVAVGVIDGV
jgi:hypothetical protein